MKTGKWIHNKVKDVQMGKKNSNEVAFLNYTQTTQYVRKPTYDSSNRVYNPLKGSNPEKFQFQSLITHYYWKEENYCKEYIA